MQCTCNIYTVTIQTIILENMYAYKPCTKSSATPYKCAIFKNGYVAIIFFGWKYILVLLLPLEKVI